MLSECVTIKYIFSIFLEILQKGNDKKVIKETQRIMYLNIWNVYVLVGEYRQKMGPSAPPVPLNCSAALAVKSSVSSR